MKKTIKIGFCLLILGAILIIFGIANNGIQSVYWQNGFHVLKQTTRTYHPKTIKTITLATASNVIIRRGDTTKIQVTTSHNRPMITTDQGHVTIKSTATNTTGFLLQSASDVTIITLPQAAKLTTVTATANQVGNLRLSNLNIDRLNLSGQGAVNLNQVTVAQPLTLDTTDDVHLNQVQAPSLTIGTEADDIHITKSQFTKTASSIKTTDGDISIHQTTFKSGHISSDEGDIVLHDNHVQQRLTVNATDGDITVRAPHQVGINATTSEGDLSIFDWQSDDQHHYQVHTDATSQYDLTTTDGDITVTAA
ncbi:hypothetical protein C5Z25_05625 [Lactobacillus sp. CBA3605]|uniref:DUF4097 family beta strand repeat-containing protein n=1 Tax=Lactobacillus sp. CBA3605 TaxID=2099788 RepID=UPI000CFAD21F|nr:DUF4097 family beta strand repeat-containing protein [Lactobacillus sp. CBA3605]AVK61278.1 hypothetical protein C5Z25_05625 [Lactobacillus sp. CBA3605]